MENLLLVSKSDLKEVLLEIISEANKKEKKQDKLLLREYAVDHKICYMTAYRRAVNGDIPSKKIGGKWYVINED